MSLLKSKAHSLQQDVLGGVTAGVVALPLALAFGISSGLGADAGLYGAIILGFLAAIFGGTATQISGPTGPITVLVASIVATAVASFNSVSNALPFLIVIFSMAGIFQIVFGLLHFGKYFRFIPYPVISGFMTGIGVIIIILQLYPAVGLKSPANIYEIFEQAPKALFNTNYTALLLTFGTITITYISQRITRIIPSSLVALLVMTTFAYVCNLKVPVIGNIPQGLPSLQMEAFVQFKISYIYHAILPALTIAALGSIDSILTAIIADTKTRTSHKSDQELIGQGIGNFIAPLFGGLPGAGATMRTVVNINNGGQTKLSGIIHSLTLTLVLVGLGSFATHIPLSVLAGILITVGVSIIDYKGLKHIPYIPQSDSWVIITVIVLTVFVGLIEAVLIGFIIASVLFMKKVSELTTSNSQVFAAHKISEQEPWEDGGTIPTLLHKKLYITHIDGPFFFGIVNHVKMLSTAIPDIKLVVIHLKDVPYIDQSGLYALEEAYDFLHHRGLEVYITGLNEQPKKLLHDVKIIPSIISEEQVFDDFDILMTHLNEQEEIGEQENPAPSG